MESLEYPGSCKVCSVRSRAAEHTIGVCLETAKNLERSECLEIAGFRHVYSLVVCAENLCFIGGWMDDLQLWFELTAARSVGQRLTY